MKKLISTLFVSLFFISVSSQIKAQYFSIGPSIGAGFSHMIADHLVIDQKMHLTWNAGITMVYSTHTHMGFGADVKFSHEGYTGNVVDDLGKRVESNVGLNYFRLPLRIIYFFGTYGDVVRPKVFIGPELGFLINANSSLSGNVKDTYNMLDAGIHGGIGLNARLMERVWLNTDLAFYQSLTDATDNDESLMDERNLQNNLALNIGVAVGFGK